MRYFIVSLFFALVLFAGDKIYYEEDITPQEAYTMQQKGAVLIDVRTSGEFIYAGHARGAINVPLFEYRYEPKSIQMRMKFAAMERKRGKIFDPHRLYSITPQKNSHFLEDIKAIAKANPGKPLLIICRSGGRSKYAANILAKNGFTKVYNVEDGFVFGWKRAGLPYGGE